MLENLRYKIIQAPMAGNIVSPRMVATICNNGMLGSIPSGYLTIEALRMFIRKVKYLTTNPFAVNVFIEDFRVTDTMLDKSHEIIEIEKQLGIYTNENFVVPKNISMNEYADLLIGENIPMVSCTFGFFDFEIIEKLKSHNIQIIATATTPEEAKYCAENGADAIVLQGVEAGGHQGSFLSNQLSNYSALELLAKVKALNVNCRLICAGGISEANMKVYFDNGADYVQIGSAFMLCEESLLPRFIKEYIVSKAKTKFTRDITGKYARGIENQLMKELAMSKVYDFPVQHYATSTIRKYARENLNPEYMSLWSGSNYENMKTLSLNYLLEQLKLACI